MDTLLSSKDVVENKTDVFSLLRASILLGNTNNKWVNKSISRIMYDVGKYFMGKTTD